MKVIEKFNSPKTHFLFLFITLSAGLMLSSCSKGGDKNNEQQNYIPEPAAGAAASAGNGNAAGQNAAPDSAAAQAEQAAATEAPAASTAAAAGEPPQAQTGDSSANTSDSSADNNAAAAASSGEQAAGTETSSAAPAPSADSAAGTSSEASSAAQAPQTSAAQAAAAVVSSSSQNLKPAFGSCDSLYQFIDQCVEFKCSVASTMLGQTIDDTFEIKGLRNDKCRFVSGIYMKKPDNSVIENASLICNFNEQQNKVISAYLKNTDNLKNATITGISDDGKNNSDNPFVTFMATNVCQKACKKNQTETELIELDSKGHFKTKKVRCPAED